MAIFCRISLICAQYWGPWEADGLAQTRGAGKPIALIPIAHIPIAPIRLAGKSPCSLFLLDLLNLHNQNSSNQHQNNGHDEDRGIGLNRIAGGLMHNPASNNGQNC